MRKYNFIFILFLIPALMFWGCSESSTDSNEVNEYEVLLSYLENEGGNFINTAGTALRSAEQVKTNWDATGQRQYIIDIRAEADYNIGHIEGAVNVALTDVLTHIENLSFSPQEIVLVCYSGQSAAYTVSLMQLLGHSNVYSMKFGMSSWHTDFATNVWLAKTSNQYATQFVTTDFPKGPVVESPVLSTGEETGEAILRARVEEVLAAGFGPAAVGASTVFASLDNYYIINYWPYEQYKDPGHIPGAMNYLPKTDLHSSTHLNTLPADKPVVTYCYTGQGSAFVSAFLQVLGYDAKSLLYGGNGMIYDMMPASKFSSGAIMDYDYVKP